MEAAETELAEARRFIDSLRMSFDLVYAMAKWMAERVPELAAAAQSAALGDIGFTHNERHHGMTFGMAYGLWLPICSCGWTGGKESSVAYARAVHEAHVREVGA